jgi:DNA-binding transcriptional MerR regulator
MEAVKIVYRTSALLRTVHEHGYALSESGVRFFTANGLLKPARTIAGHCLFSRADLRALLDHLAMRQRQREPLRRPKLNVPLHDRRRNV